MIVRSNGTQKESQVIQMPQKKTSLLHYNVDYDSIWPEKLLRDFIAEMKDAVAKYEWNRNRIGESEAELIDLLHWIEITPNKKVPDGYKLYRKLADLRRERRCCKNENDLLQPIYEYFHATEVLNRLAKVQGECAKAKEAIDARTYAIRTDILDEYLEPETSTIEVDDDIYRGGITTEQFFGRDLIQEKEAN